MKRAIVSAALMLQAVAFAGVAFAQTDEIAYVRLPHRFQIFVEGGGALPTRPAIWNDLWNSAFGFGMGAGMSIFPWLEVNAGFSTMSFSLNALQAKGVIGYQGIQEVEGGTVSAKQYYGSARFLAVPNARTNPYVEVAAGYYSSSGEDVVIEGVLVNTMESVSGLSVAPSVGIQYALGDRWSAYARYTYMMNFSDTFTPGDLLQPVGGGRPDETGNQVIQFLGVGVLVRF